MTQASSKSSGTGRLDKGSTESDDFEAEDAFEVKKEEDEDGEKEEMDDDEDSFFKPQSGDGGFPVDTYKHAKPRIRKFVRLNGFLSDVLLLSRALQFRLCLRAELLEISLRVTKCWAAIRCPATPTIMIILVRRRRVSHVHEFGW